MVNDGYCHDSYDSYMLVDAVGHSSVNARCSIAIVDCFRKFEGGVVATNMGNIQ
jgi:hypothetical protein